MASLTDLMREDPRVAQIVRSASLSHAAAARAISEIPGYTTSEKSVRRARKHLPERVHTQPEKGAAEAVASDVKIGAGKADITPDSVTFHGVVLDENCQQEKDWSRVFQIFKLDPDEFEIVDDTVRISTWQQSARSKDGDRDLIQLWSHSAKFRQKRTVGSEMPTVEDYRDFIGIGRAYATPEPLGEAAPSTFVFCAADFQLGKSAGGGVDETLRRFNRALDDAVARVLFLRASGRNIERVLIAQMGDVIEAVQGHYASQTFTVELNLRDQLTLAVDVLLKCVDAFAQVAPRVTLLSVISNHGEISRSPNTGSKAITDSGDSADVLVARMVERVVRATPGLEHVDFVTPDDEIIIMETLSGVPVAFTHGHTGPSSSDNIKAENEWMAKQSLNLLRRYASEPKLWFTAHRHHFMALDLGPYFRLQCPSLDGGSAWFENVSGKWSTAGVLTCLVGLQDESRKFSDLQIL